MHVNNNIARIILGKRNSTSGISLQLFIENTSANVTIETASKRREMELGEGERYVNARTIRGNPEGHMA